MNCAFIDIQKNLLNVHFPQKETLDLLTASECAHLLYRAVFYLKIDLMLFEYWQTLDDKWLFIAGEKIAWHYLIHKKKLTPSDVVSFDKQAILFFLYEDAVNSPLPQELKTDVSEIITVSGGIKPIDSLQWNPDSEWVPGVIQSAYQTLSGDNALVIREL